MKKLLIILLISLLPSLVFGATIYVDNSGCGDCADYRVVQRDCGSGTEQNYDTIQEAVDALSAAGDIINVRPGTYNETVTGTSKQVGASWESPITIQGYTGDAMPVINGGASYAFIAETLDDYYWIFDGLKFTRADISSTNYTLFTANTSYFRIQNSTIDGCWRGYNAGSVIADNITFDGGGTAVQPIAWQMIDIGGHLVQDCNITNYTGRGIWIADAGDGNKILRNKIYDSTSHAATGSAGIDIDNYGKANQSDSNIVEDNFISNWGNNGIQFENCTNSIMRGNWSYQNDYGFCVIDYDAYRGNNTNNILHSNISVESLDGGIRIIEAYGTKIYNNTIYNNTTSHGCITLKGTTYPCNNTDIRNNTMYQPAASDACLWFPEGTPTGITCDYNIYYNASQTDVIYDEDSAAWYTLAEWVAATAYDDNSIQDNPDFTTVGSDFTLTSVSPAIGAGADLGNGLYYGLDPTSTWTGNVKPVNQDDYGDWEIGAFVYIIAGPTGGPGTIVGGGSGSIAGGGSGTIVGTTPE